MVVMLENQMFSEATREAAHVGQRGEDGAYALMIEEPSAMQDEAQAQTEWLEGLRTLFAGSIRSVPLEMLGSRQFKDHVKTLMSQFQHSLNMYIAAPHAAQIPSTAAAGALESGDSAPELITGELRVMGDPQLGASPWFGGGVVDGGEDPGDASDGFMKGWSFDFNCMENQSATPRPVRSSMQRVVGCVE